jgi:hypothetical protein
MSGRRRRRADVPRGHRVGSVLPRHPAAPAAGGVGRREPGRPQERRHVVDGDGARWRRAERDGVDRPRREASLAAGRPRVVGVGAGDGVAGDGCVAGLPHPEPLGAERLGDAACDLDVVGAVQVVQAHLDAAGRLDRAGAPREAPHGAPRVRGAGSSARRVSPWSSRETESPFGRVRPRAASTAPSVWSMSEAPPRSFEDTAAAPLARAPFAPRLTTTPPPGTAPPGDGARPR